MVPRDDAPESALRDAAAERRFMAPHLLTSAAAAAADPGGVGSTALVLYGRQPGRRLRQAAPTGPSAGVISRPRRSSRPSVRPSFLVPRDDTVEAAQREAAAEKRFMAPHLQGSAAAAAVDPGGVGSTALAEEGKQCGLWCGQCGQCGLRGRPVSHRSRFTPLPPPFSDPAEGRQCLRCGHRSRGHRSRDACGACGLGHRSRFACRTKQRARYDHGTPDGRRPPNRRPLPSPGGPTRVVSKPRRSARLLIRKAVLTAQKKKDQEGA